MQSTLLESKSGAMSLQKKHQGGKDCDGNDAVSFVRKVNFLGEDDALPPSEAQSGTPAHRPRPLSPTSNKESCRPMQPQLQQQHQRAPPPLVPTLATASISETVDSLEKSLARCLADYRAQAEEVIAAHEHALEERRAACELKVANLTAENALLRQQLRLNPAEHQPVLFQAQQAQEIKHKGKKKTQKMLSTPADNDQLLDFRKNSARSKQSPAGSWQPFVAWVPNCAALQTPEPWKALPQQDIVAAGQTVCEGSKRRSSSRKQGPGAAVVQMATVVPGHVDDGQMPKTQMDADIDKLDESGSEATSEQDQDEKYDLCDIWKTSEKQKQKMNNSRPSDGQSSVGISICSSHLEEDAFFQQSEVKFPFDPDSNVRVVWDLASMSMVFYDTIMVPMMAFDMPEDAFLILMDWVTRLFWTFDIGMSCCTGVMLADGRIEHSMKGILCIYARSWLALDLLVVSSDWFGVIFSSGSLGLGKLVRVSRIARIVRLLRLVRMKEVIANMSERIRLDKARLAARIGQMLVLLFMMAHFSACLWFNLGNDSTDDETWVKQNSYANESVWGQYLGSMLWALCQFSGVMSGITPVSSSEKLFAVVIGMLSFMATLAMTSAFTSNLTQDYIIGGNGQRQMATLKKYLKQNWVPKHLTKRLCRNANHAISGDLTPDAVELLSVISEPLQVEMHFAIFSKVLVWHPLFKDLLGDPESIQLVRRVCNKAMSTLLLAQGDMVFGMGEEPTEPKMYIVVSGRLEYTDAYGESSEVVEKSWLAEAVLWTHWKHQGTLTVEIDAKLVALDAHTFQEISKRQIKKRNPVCLTLLRYAADFVAELNREDMLTDLPLCS